MKLTLTRDSFSDCTLGKLAVNDVYECECLEDKDRKLECAGEKIYGKTAIPRGTYKIVIDYSNRFKRSLPRLLNVPGFEGIRIHSGNTSADTEGCILVGLSRSGSSITESRAAFNVLFAKLKEAFETGEQITIEVK